MAVSEKNVTGKFYRIWSAADKLWHRISFWTHANDVEFNDGKTAQTKVGAIKGITTSTSATETGYAADATTVAALNQSLDNDKWVNWDGSKLPNDKKIKTIMISMQCHSDKSYGVSTLVIPMSQIVAGSYINNTVVTCTSPDGYISSLTFTITKTGAFKSVSLKSNNQYYVPKYTLYYK